MKTCCTNITIPETCPTCTEIVDACCVLNQLPLTCLFPEPLLTDYIEAKGSLNAFTLTVRVKNYLGIKLGDVLSHATGFQLVADGAVVTAITLTSTGTSTSVYNISVDKANVGNSPNTFVKTDLTRYRTEIPQCDINQAVNDFLCDLSGQLDPSGTCCPEWTTLNPGAYEASGGYSWSDATAVGVEFEPLQYTTPVSCNCNEVRFKGMLNGYRFEDWTTMFTMPVGARPGKVRVYPVNVFLMEYGVEVTTQDVIPSLIRVFPTGEVQVRLKEYCCSGQILLDVPRFNVFVPLEGISYEAEL